MNQRTRILRATLILALSLLILFVVIQFAPATHAPHDARLALSTEVAAATVLPPPSVTLAPTAAAPSASSAGILIFSANRDGYTELYAATRATIDDATQWRQLTNGYSPAQAPALSPDGKKLAFQSRKDGNWEIYVLDLASGGVTRVTKDLAYDGAPSWSPDSQQIAFESYRAGDLDIWRMQADGSNPTNLTADEPAYDFAPTWSPDGKTIVYTSWSTGNRQLFAMAPDGTHRVNISNNGFHDEQPTWSPDGKQLAFVSNREGCNDQFTSTLENLSPAGGVEIGNCQRRNVYVADWNGGTLGKVKQISFNGRDLAPAWSPDGKAITFIAARHSGEPLYTVPSAGGIATPLNQTPVHIDSAVWLAGNTMPKSTLPVSQAPLYVEKPIISPPTDGSQYDFVAMKDVRLAPSYGIFSSRVSESFRALRQRVKTESGIDFLGTLSDMTRLITSRCDVTCEDLSWHKAGRAMDTLLTLPRNGSETVIIVREDEDGEVYWHVYLRAAKQDGSMGAPLTAAPWDISYNARAVVAPGLGGVEGPVLSGYFVDFTELARDYGWLRISSHDDSDFDWRNNLQGLEFWHFEKEDGLNWWQVMLEVYSPQQLRDVFDWNTIVDQWLIDPSRIYLKHVPPPPDAWKWYGLVAP